MSSSTLHLHASSYQSVQQFLKQSVLSQQRSDLIDSLSIIGTFSQIPLSLLLSKMTPAGQAHVWQLYTSIYMKSNTVTQSVRYYLEAVYGVVLDCKLQAALLYAACQLCQLRFVTCATGCPLQFVWLNLQKVVYSTSFSSKFSLIGKGWDYTV